MYPADGLQARFFLLGNAAASCVREASRGLEEAQVFEQLGELLSHPLAGMTTGGSGVMGEAVGQAIRNVGWSSFKAYLPISIVSTTFMIGFPMAVKYTLESLVEELAQPALTDKELTKLHGLNTTLRTVFGRPLSGPVTGIYNPKTKTQFDDYMKGLTNAKQNNQPLPNALFFGPGGTGKTLTAQRIAHELGFNFIATDGGLITQFAEKNDGPTHLEKLLGWAKNKSIRGTILFIDEADAFLGRAETLTHKHRALLSTFKRITGENHRNLCIILATNYPKDLDPMICDRMDFKIKCDLPNQDNRAKLVTLYVEKSFNEERNNVLDDAAIVEIAKRTKGFSGRKIMKMALRLKSKKDCSEDKTLTTEMVDEIVETYIKQEHDALVPQDFDFSGEDDAEASPSPQLTAAVA